MKRAQTKRLHIRTYIYSDKQADRQASHTTTVADVQRDRKINGKERGDKPTDIHINWQPVGKT